MSTNAFGQRLEPRATHRVPQQPSSRVPSFRLDWVEPLTLRRQKKGQNAYTFALSLDLLVMLSDPGPHLLAVMPGGIIERLKSQLRLPCSCSRVQIHSQRIGW